MGVSNFRGCPICIISKAMATFGGSVGLLAAYKLEFYVMFALVSVNGIDPPLLSSQISRQQLSSLAKTIFPSLFDSMKKRTSSNSTHSRDRDPKKTFVVKWLLDTPRTDRQTLSLSLLSDGWRERMDRTGGGKHVGLGHVKPARGWKFYPLS